MQDFMNEWLGKKVDYDGVYGYQCVDLIKQYLAEKFGLRPGAWGDAKDYWLSTNPAILKYFDRLQTTGALAGDIVILKPLSAPEGHIGIATGKTNSTQVEILEQNGSTGNGKGTGPDAIRTRFVDKSRMYGVLRPKPKASPAEQIAEIRYNLLQNIRKALNLPADLTDEQIADRTIKLWQDAQGSIKQATDIATIRKSFIDNFAKAAGIDPTLPEDQLVDQFVVKASQGGITKEQILSYIQANLK